jgi:hypothetical protein
MTVDIRLLIIVPSPYNDNSRFTARVKDEWTEAWGFDSNRLLAVRKAEDKDIYYSDDVDGIKSWIRDEKTIIWLNTKKALELRLGIAALLQNIVGQCRVNPEEVWIAYHLPDNYIPKIFRRPRGGYSLEWSELPRFRPILRANNTFDNAAPFEVMLDCFCIDMPKRVARFRHRIAHLFTPIDIDLQGLIASNFRADYCEKVVAAHRAVATMVIEEARKMKGELYMVATVSQKKVIDEKWQQAEKELRRMEPLLTALQKGELDERKKEEAENFRKAFCELLRILDELDDELRALDERRK